MISVEEWRNSGQPENMNPLRLTAVLERAAELGPVSVVRAISPDFEGQRLFRVPSGSSEADFENRTALLGFCREKAEAVAMVFLPDGRGLCSYGDEIRSFSLSALPDGFVYTGAALLGKVIVASWEEQLEAGIGAAGFMLMALEGIF